MVSLMKTLFLLCILCTSVNAVDATANKDAIERAIKRQHTAEQALADARKNIMDQRRALTQQLQQAQQEMHAAREHSQESGTVLKRLQDLRQQAVLQQSQQANAYRLRIDTASAGLGITAPIAAEDIRPQALQKIFSQALSDKLSALQRDSRIIVVPQTISQRDGSQYETQVIHLGTAQHLARGTVAQSVNSSGLLLQHDGAFIVNGPHFSAQQQQAMQDFSATAGGYIIADIDSALVTQDIRPWEFGQWLRKGGFFVWPIFAVGLAAIVLALERLFTLRALRIRPALCDECVLYLKKEDYAQAESLVAGRKSPLQRVLHCALAARQQSPEQRETQVEAALLAEEPLLERNKSVLAVLAAVAPLLGLLGTVTGMIGTFHSLAVYGTGNPALLSDGISEALITTQVGLVVAVPILLIHGVISRMIESRQTILEHSALQVIGQFSD